MYPCYSFSDSWSVLWHSFCCLAYFFCQLACRNMLPAIHNTQCVWFTSCDLEESGLNCVLIRVCLSACWKHLSQLLFACLCFGPHRSMIAVFILGKTHDGKCARVHMKLTKYSSVYVKVSSVVLAFLSFLAWSRSPPLASFPNALCLIRFAGYGTWMPKAAEWTLLRHR